MCWAKIVGFLIHTDMWNDNRFLNLLISKKSVFAKLMFYKKDDFFHKINRKHSLIIFKNLNPSLIRDPSLAEFITGLLKKLTFRDVEVLQNIPFELVSRDCAKQIYLNGDAFDLSKAIDLNSGQRILGHSPLGLGDLEVKSILLKESGLKESNIVFQDSMLCSKVFMHLENEEIMQILNNSDFKGINFSLCIENELRANKLESFMVHMVKNTPVNLIIFHALVKKLTEAKDLFNASYAFRGYSKAFEIQPSTEDFLIGKILCDEEFRDELLCDFSLFSDVYCLFAKSESKNKILDILLDQHSNRSDGIAIKYTFLNRWYLLFNKGNLFSDILTHEKCTPKKFYELFEESANLLCSSGSVFLILLRSPKASLLCEKGIQKILDTETEAKILNLWSWCVEDICFHPIIAKTVYKHPKSSLLLKDSYFGENFLLNLAADAYTSGLINSLQIYSGLFLMSPILIYLLLRELSIDFGLESGSDIMLIMMMGGFLLFTSGLMRHLGGKCIVEKELWTLYAFNFVLLGLAILTITSFFDNAISDLITQEVFDEFNCNSVTKIGTQVLAICSSIQGLYSSVKVLNAIEEEVGKGKLVFFKT